MKNILILALCVFVVGCSSTPIDHETVSDTDESNDSYNAMSEAEDSDTYLAMGEDEELVSHDTILEEDMDSNDTLIEDEHLDSNDNTADAMTDESNEYTESELTHDEQISGDNSNQNLAKENRALRLEIAELTSVIMSLTNDNNAADLRKNKNSKSNTSNKKNKLNKKIKAGSVNLVMRFNSSSEQKTWWKTLGDAGIKDKFLSNSKGEYIIYLGNFNDHNVAKETKTKIMNATGARTIETISAS